MELLINLGINGKLLIAQVINFLVLLFVLKKFAYRPVLKMLNERTKKIEKGLRDAEEAKRKLAEMEQKEKEILRQAKLEAQEIVKNAQTVAVKDADRIMVEAKEQAEKMIADAKKQINQEKEKTMGEIRAEVADLVVMATERVIAKKVDSDKDKELIEKIIH